METWILFTFLAAFMQAVRTAGQKKISQHISPMATTLVRYLFGLPFLVGYFLLVTRHSPLDVLIGSVSHTTFFIYASLASVAQIMATMWLVKVMGFRNFSVATSFAKTEAIQTAVLGAIFFSAFLSWLGWLAVMLAVIGILVLSLPGRDQAVDKKSIYYGVLSGGAFALTSLWLRKASLSLGYSYIENAAVTLVYMVSVQTLLCLIYIALKEYRQFSTLKNHMPLAIFVGATSALGSIGWFTAMTYQNAALVKSLGQIEIIFTLIITYVFFNEKISLKELLGMAAIISSVIILLLGS